MTEDDLKRIERDHEGLPGWDDVCELIAEVRRLRTVVDINGGLGEYRGGKPFAMKEAREALIVKS